MEIDVGSHRCGDSAGEPALELARQVAASPGLRFIGLQGYYGAAQHRRPYEERRAAGNAAAELCALTRDLLLHHGFECPTITGAGTGTLNLRRQRCLQRAASRLLHLMDADYAQNLASDGGPVHTFEQVCLSGPLS